MTALSPDFRRVVAVLLLLLTVAAGNELLVQPLLGLYRDLNVRWQESSLRLGHYQRAAARLDSLGEARRQLETAAEGPQPYVTAESEALAVAELQETVRRVAEAEGAELIGTRVLATVSEGGFQRLGLRVTLAATLAPLQAFLYALESGPPLRLIDDLSIQRRDARPAAIPADGDPLLDVGFDIVVYRQEPS
jgi:general secretion pathway protein M